jgi:Rrf2 family protein
MKMSTQEEYGLRCLLRVGREGSLTISELARREGISEANVAKMMRILRKSGFVRSTRGQAGGYMLARPAEDIAVGHVLAALGGRLFDSDFCGTHAGVSSSCTHLGDCSIRSVWRTIQTAIDSVLGQMSLKDLLRSEEEMNVWAKGRGTKLPVAAFNA